MRPYWSEPVDRPSLWTRLTNLIDRYLNGPR